MPRPKVAQHSCQKGDDDSNKQREAIPTPRLQRCRHVRPVSYPPPGASNANKKASKSMQQHSPLLSGLDAKAAPEDLPRQVSTRYQVWRNTGITQEGVEQECVWDAAAEEKVKLGPRGPTEGGGGGG